MQLQQASLLKKFNWEEKKFSRMVYLEGVDSIAWKNRLCTASSS